MCRNIRTLHNFEPPATREEIHAAALQYVRKVSGSTRPSAANAPAVDAAVAAVEAAADLELVAALGRNDSLDTLVDAGARIVVDLTVPESTEANVRFAVEHGMHAVVGTTGWDADRLARLEELLAGQAGEQLPRGLLAVRDDREAVEVGALTQRHARGPVVVDAV